MREMRGGCGELVACGGRGRWMIAWAGDECGEDAGKRVMNAGGGEDGDAGEGGGW